MDILLYVSFSLSLSVLCFDFRMFLCLKPAGPTNQNRLENIRDAFFLLKPFCCTHSFGLNCFEVRWGQGLNKKFGLAWGGLQISSGQFCMCNFTLLWLLEPSMYEHCPLISTIQGLQINHLHVVVFEFRFLLPEAKALEGEILCRMRICSSVGRLTGNLRSQHELRCFETVYCCFSLFMLMLNRPVHRVTQMPALISTSPPRWNCNRLISVQQVVEFWACFNKCPSVFICARALQAFSYFSKFI